MKKLICYLVLGISPQLSIAEIEKHCGLYREMGKVNVFWPSSYPAPHYVVVDDLAKPGTRTILKKSSGRFIIVEADLSGESKAGLDGIATIHNVLFSERGHFCETHNQ